MRVRVYSQDELSRIRKQALVAAKPIWAFAEQQFDEPMAAYGIALGMLIISIFDVDSEVGDFYAETLNKMLEHKGHPWRLVKTS